MIEDRSLTSSIDLGDGDAGLVCAHVISASVQPLSCEPYVPFHTLHVHGAFIGHAFLSRTRIVGHKTQSSDDRSRR